MNFIDMIHHKLTDSFSNYDIIQKGQDLYYNLKVPKTEIDKIITPLLELLKGKKIVYMHRYMLKTGVVTGFKKDQLHLRDGLYRRRILLKNIYIYDEVILSLLSLYK